MSAERKEGLYQAICHACGLEELTDEQIKQIVCYLQQCQADNRKKGKE